MDSLPFLKQLVELLHWILVSIDEVLASWGLGPNWTWGLSIIGLTIVVRLVLFPLTWKQFSSAQRMQVLQPKIKDLQKKYKNDRGKLQEETMKLYQEHRVNPFASCLPILLQLPVFIALYYAIKGTSYLDPASTEALSNASFLWIPHLGQPDPYYILLVVYVASQLISTELMLTPHTDKQQKYIMRAMPIIFVFFLYSFPAGLFVYWVTTNLWTIGQQLIIRRVMKPVTDVSQLRPAKRSRIMDAMAKAQEQRVQQRQDLLDKHGLPADGGQRGSGTAGKTGAGKAGAGKTGGGRSGQGGTRKSGSRPSGKPRGGKTQPPPGKGKSKSGPGG
jgi:YidC/Oxa1 family membrane protein insertase